MKSEADLWGTLTGLNVTLLQRWGSTWADLLAADMALHERGKLDDARPANLFLRRALWESAVASYGRCAVSGNKRKVAFVDFVKGTVGDEGMALHERIMDWRHGHVAHRNRPEFESAETVLTFANGPSHPTSLNLVLGIDLGPTNSDAFLLAFQGHIKTLRDAIWEKQVWPLVVDVVGDINSGRIPRPTDLRPAEDQSSMERYVINQCLSTLGAGEPIRS